MECSSRVYYAMKNAMFQYFLALVLIGLSFGIFCKAYSHYHHEPKYYYLTKILGNGLCIARGTAPVLNVTMALITLPMCRPVNVILNALFGRWSIRVLVLYLEKIKLLHIYLGMGLVLVGSIHTLAHVVNIINFVRNYDQQFSTINWATDENDSTLRLLFLTSTGFSGCVMLATLFTITYFSSRRMRDRFYNSFLKTHTLFLLFYAMMFYHPLGNIIKFQTNLNAHPVGCEDIDEKIFRNYTICGEIPKFSAGEKKAWIWPLLGLSVYIFDVVYRYATVHSDARIVTTLQSHLLPGKGVYLKLCLPQNSHIGIRTGQYILLQCPAISTTEWHPFTVLELPTANSNSISVAVSVRGDWTQKLYNEVTERQRILKFLLDGPYPSVMMSMTEYKRIVYIGAGVGITPFAGFVKYLLTSNPIRPLRIHLIWLIRNVEILTWFLNELTTLQEMFWQRNEPDRLSLKVYWTRDYDEQLLEEYFCDYPMLKARIFQGRPVWDKIFQELTVLYPKKAVTIFNCGPKALKQELRNMSAKYGKEGGNFIFLHDGFG